jgi:CheY-like chemotaxis protein
VAVESLALHLVEQDGLADRLGGLRAANLSSTGAPAAAPLPESLQWIFSLPRTEQTVLERALPEVLRLVQPLAERHQKRLVCAGDGNCTIGIHPLVFRQAMLHLLNAAILHCAGSEVQVSVACEPLHVRIAVQAGCAAFPAKAGAAGWDTPKELDTEEQIVQQMLAAYGASLHLAGGGDGWLAVLRCDRVQEQPVLVIDDHPDTVELLKRYVEGTRYRIVATDEPQRALELAQEEYPFIVLLDVMMPGVDGWEVLTRLKGHEATAALPVWVCTVLDQSELALSLGADGFLRKPVTREALLAVLDAQAAREPALP